MNGAHLHLALNHLPIFAIVFALLFLGFGLARRHPAIIRAGLLLVALGAAGAGGAFLTGEPAEEVVEDQPGITESRIHEHEEAGEFALWVTIAAGVAALAALWQARSRSEGPGRGATGVAVALALVALATLARTAWLGGEISHPEIRGDAVMGAVMVTPDREVGD
ncbi:MAG: DUF2231 domain-containing protein [Gemmatimonadales bacterium]